MFSSVPILRSEGLGFGLAALLLLGLGLAPGKLIRLLDQAVMASGQRSHPCSEFVSQGQTDCSLDRYERNASKLPDVVLRKLKRILKLKRELDQFLTERE